MLSRAAGFGLGRGVLPMKIDQRGPCCDPQGLRLERKAEVSSLDPFLWFRFKRRLKQRLAERAVRTLLGKLLARRDDPERASGVHGEQLKTRIDQFEMNRCDAPAARRRPGA
jgi:hypothetical protein